MARSKPKETNPLIVDRGRTWTPYNYGYNPNYKPLLSADVSALPDVSMTGTALPTTQQAPSKPSVTMIGNAPAPQWTPIGIMAPERAQVANMLTDPAQLDALAKAQKWEKTPSLMQSIFDTSDEADVFGEGVWDSMLRGVGWAYDRTSQVVTKSISDEFARRTGGVSALITPKLSWGQADQVSAGQFVTAAGENAAALASTLAGKQNAPQFVDVTDPKQREEFFNSGYGKYVSGTIDFGISLYADPFIMLGGVAKAGRIKYLDKAYTSAADLEVLKADLDSGIYAVKNAGASPTKVSPEAQFILWAKERDAAGNLVRTHTEIAKHRAIKFATSREFLTDALMAADNEEQASLVFRYAAGDPLAREELLRQRVDILEAMTRLHREQLAVQLMFRPQDRLNQLMKYEDRATKFAEEHGRVSLAFSRGEATKQQVNYAYAQWVQAQDAFEFVRDVKLPDPASMTKLDRIAAKEQKFIVDEAMKFQAERDVFYQKALQAERSKVNGIFNVHEVNPLFDSLGGSTAGFSKNNALGRFVEGSRERRATAAYQTEATRGALVERKGAGTLTRSDQSVSKQMRHNLPWENDFFKNGPLDRGRMLWRRVSAEKPSGSLQIRGLGLQESSREIEAALNDIPEYSGKAREIRYTVMEPRRDKTGKWIKDSNGEKVLFETVKVETVGGLKRKQELIAKYYDAVSRSVHDPAAMHRMMESLEEEVLKDLGNWHGMTKQATDQIISRTQYERNALIEHIRSTGYWMEDGVKQTSPFLDSHLQNSTFMLNFRAISKRMRLADESQIIKNIDTGAQWTAEQFASFNDFFQSLWRPATLLRLGYTQRNVTEGLIRATAFMYANDPEHLADPIRDAMKGVTLGAKNAVKKRWTPRVAERIAKGTATPRDLRQYDKWLNSQKEAADLAVSRLEKHMEFLKDELIDKPGRAQQDIEFTTRMLQHAYDQRAALNNETVALELFREQGRTMMRIHQGEATPQTDAWTMQSYLMSRGAFDNPDINDVAFNLMSSNNTKRMESTLVSDSTNSILLRKIEKEFVEVKPSEPTYFDGVARVLMQFKNSEIGAMLINEATDDAIAGFLRKEGAGRDIARFLDDSAPANMDAFHLIDMEDAIGYAQKMRARYMSIARTPEIRDYLKAGGSLDGATAKRMLGEIEDMPPIIGNYAIELGVKDMRQTINDISHKLFQYLGSMPEDALIRAPFYSRRYNAIRDDMFKKILDAKEIDRVSLKTINDVLNVAHRRALKDTNDWLYTIPRRTLLGHYLETVFPFISATQNSVTTIGRLVWSDPRLLAYGLKAWNAPDKAGMTDEDGNIVIPAPWRVLPQSMQKSLGLDNMMNMKISKNGLNVIFPMSNMLFVPSFGPLVATPASEIMKHGWFGMTVYTPEPIVAHLGQEMGDALWNGWKDWLFNGRGLSDSFASLDMVLPPWVQKLEQRFQGELGSTEYASQYTLQYNAEMAKYWAGYRQDVPEPDEIRNRVNNIFMLRMMGNLTAFTPPKYESVLQPLVDAVQAIYNVDPVNGSKNVNEILGPYLAQLGDISSLKNQTSMFRGSTPIQNATRYSALINKVSSGVQSDYSVLGIILNTNANANEYDESSSAWMLANNIPGVSDKFGVRLSPNQVTKEAQRSAGWVWYVKKMDVIDSIRQQRGLKSYRAQAAGDLKAARDQVIERLRTDPAFEGWYDDYSVFGSARTLNTIKVLQAALADETFMKDNGDSGTWQAARRYLAGRDMVLAGKMNQDQWDALRTSLIDGDTNWATIANRYLNGDDNPMKPGVTYASQDWTK